MDNDNRTFIQKKVDAFFLLGDKVHVSFKEQRRWLNGIIKQVKDEYFIIDETEDGMTPIFYSEIINISKFTEPKMKGERYGNT